MSKLQEEQVQQVECDFNARVPWVLLALGWWTVTRTYHCFLAFLCIPPPYIYINKKITTNPLLFHPSKVSRAAFIPQKITKLLMVMRYNFFQYTYIAAANNNMTWTHKLLRSTFLTTVFFTTHIHCGDIRNRLQNVAANGSLWSGTEAALFGVQVSMGNTVVEALSRWTKVIRKVFPTCTSSRCTTWALRRVLAYTYCVSRKGSV